MALSGIWGSFQSLIKCLENKWAVTPQSERLNSFNSVSRGCVNVTILIYFTLNCPLENTHQTSEQKIQIFITFYLVSKSLISHKVRSTKLWTRYSTLMSIFIPTSPWKSRAANTVAGKMIHPLKKEYYWNGVMLREQKLS